MHPFIEARRIKQMALRVFASAWGNATHWGSLRRLMDGLKFKGFAGLEASLSDLGDDADARAAVGWEWGQCGNRRCRSRDHEHQELCV